MICVFKCKWVDNNEPFIMAEQAKQVFYVQGPCDERWLGILHEKTIVVNVEYDDSIVDTYLSPFSTQILPNINKEEVHDVHANRNDHDEGELINTV